MQLNIFLTGATGYIGGAIAEALLARGHRVTGLVRSDDAASKLSAKGVVPHRGDLASPASLADVTRSSDGVIHAGTTSDGRLDREAVRAMLEALGGSGKPFVYTSGVWVLGDTGGAVADESAPLKPAALVAWRPGVEAMVLESARHGVRSVVIRPAIVYGRARGIPADFVKSARETGAARLVGSGENHWPTVHVEDLADLYVRAVERAEAGMLLHAAQGAYRVIEIAEAASGGLTECWPLVHARETLGAYADALVLDQQVSAEKAKATLGWNPRAASIIDDLRHGSYR